MTIHAENDWFRVAAPRPAPPENGRARGAEAPSSAAAALPWLISLRWHAVVGQTLAVAITAGSLSASTPVGALLALIAALAISNALLSLYARRVADPGMGPLGAVLLFDTLQLTVQLALSGGPHNPFSVLYFVEILIAVLALSARWITAVTAAAIGGFSLLFPLHRTVEGLPPAAESVGEWTAVVLAIGTAAYLGGRIAGTLREQAAALARSQKLAGRAEQLASLSALAAGAAHELGTPLGTIAIAARELEELIDRAPEEALEEARVVRDEVDRCRAILDRMSGRAGAAVGELPEPISAAAVLAIVRHDLGAAERSRVVVEGDLDAEVRCPVQSLVQVLAALVTNGLQASPEGAVVSVGVAAGTRAVRFAIVDRGSGIPTAILPRLGEPFFTTKPPGKGMGLGLFLAQSYAELCAGRLEIDSTEGQGTCVSLVLPRLARAR